MKATIIGGSGREAVQAVNGFEGLKQYMTSGGNYDKETAAAPLAYKMRHLCDNATCRIVMANDYVIRSCEELKPGRHGVLHRGGYVAWFYVYYTLDGEPVSWYSGKYTSGGARAMNVPAKARNIVVVAQEATGLVWDPVRTIFRYPGSGSMPRPEVKCWKVKGTTLHPGYEVIDCTF